MTVDTRLIARRRRIGASLLVSVVATVVAAAVHAAAGGGVPSAPAVAVALMLSLAIGTLVVGPRLSRGRTAVGVLTDQVVFHSVFAFFGSASLSGLAPVGHVHAHDSAPLIATIAPGVASAPSAVMIVSHIAAAVVAYGMLRSGIRAVEKVVRALARAVTRALHLPDPTALPTLPQTIVTAFVDQVRSAHLRLPESRGPPALAVA